MVRPKPERQEPEDLPDEVKAIINKGGTVAADHKKEGLESKKEEWATISLRIPINVLEEVDTIVKKRLGLTRTAWILESIQRHMKE